MFPGEYAVAVKDLSNMLIEVCGENYVFTSREHLYNYETDHTLNLRCPFEILVKPASPEEVAGILKICDRHRVPVTPRGGGSGVTGGALPVMGGVVLSLERLNKIISINKPEAYVVAESGVITGHLSAAVEAEGLYYPVSPSSSSYSFIGGNVAENAGSVNSCKFGSTARYVLNLEVVLPNGEIIWTGSNVSKSAAGLNLTQLFVGSEGILGVITKIVYRLLPPCLPEIFMLAAFDCLENACKTVLEIRRDGLLPSAVELICKDAILLTSGFLNQPLPLVTDDVEALLLIGLQERDPSSLHRSLEDVAGLIPEFTSKDVLVGQTADEKDKLGKLRFNIGNAMTAGKRFYRDIDACVPLSEMYGYIRKVQRISGDNGLALACFGHALDGNLHTMIILNEDTHGTPNVTMDKAIYEIYAYAVSVGGVISGEHGIGLLQKKYMTLQYTGEQLIIMKKLKDLFDPNGILNPGKLL